jgi:diguanylate cyclase (GGDEF)-like protein
MNTMLMTGRSFKEMLLLSISGVLILALTPLAIFSMLNEDWSASALEASVVVVMLGLFLYVYVSRETRRSGTIMAVTFVSAAVGLIRIMGPGEIHWLYPALTAIFFLLDARNAIMLAAGAFGATLALLWNPLSLVGLFSVSLTLTVNILFAYFFALNAKRQRERLEHLANVDPLTGAGNRRAQDRKLDAVSALFHRANIPCSILILDVDHFKKINDGHGHTIGDNILVEVAELISTNTRPSENLYRYGGEEFTIVAENTGMEGAHRLAEKLRELIDENAFSSGIHVTASFGVAEVQRGEGPRGWLGRADRALFKAKERGRNRVVLAAPAPPPPPKLKPRLVAVET